MFDVKLQNLGISTITLYNLGIWTPQPWDLLSRELGSELHNFGISILNLGICTEKPGDVHFITLESALYNLGICTLQPWGYALQIFRIRIPKTIGFELYTLRV